MTGRQAMILGKKWVINLNNKGGVRKSPGTNAYARCWGQARKKGKDPYEAASECKGKKGS